MGTEGIILFITGLWSQYFLLYNSSPNINVRPQNVGIPTVDDIADSGTVLTFFVQLATGSVISFTDVTNAVRVSIILL